MERVSKLKPGTVLLCFVRVCSSECPLFAVTYTVRYVITWAVLQFLSPVIAAVLYTVLTWRIAGCNCGSTVRVIQHHRDRLGSLPVHRPGSARSGRWVPSRCSRSLITERTAELGVPQSAAAAAAAHRDNYWAVCYGVITSAEMPTGLP